MATITKRGNSYRITVSARYDENGKQTRKTMTWRIPEGMTAKKAEKEVQKVAFEFEREMKLGLSTDSKIKFQEFAERWFTDYADSNLRPTTLARYRELMERITPVFGTMLMNEIQPMHLNKFYKQLSEVRINIKAHCKIDLKEYLKKKGIQKQNLATASGVSQAVITSCFTGKNIECTSAEKIATALKQPYSKVFINTEGDLLSAKTIQHYHRLLSSIFEKAVKWQVIVNNPCDRADPPKPDKVEPVYLDQEQSITCLNALQTAPTQFRCACEILLYTGMRRGELLGLEWSDIDYEHQLINIHHTSLYLKDQGIFEDETKNTSSNRVIKVPQSVIADFKTMWKWQAEQHLLKGEAWINSGKVFTALDGSPMHPDTLSGWFHDFIESLDLPEIHLHSLRHTNATLMIANGVAVTTVAGQLGHANASTTTKIYAHAIKSAQAEASDMMEDLLKHQSIG